MICCIDSQSLYITKFVCIAKFDEIAKPVVENARV